MLSFTHKNSKGYVFAKFLAKAEISKKSHRHSTYVTQTKNSCF